MDRQEFSEKLMALLEFEFNQIMADMDLTLEKNNNKISSEEGYA